MVQSNCFTKFLERRFSLEKKNVSIRSEFLAGVTTFLSMVYILSVNPSILGATGMNPVGVFVATALAAFVGTIAMAFYANYPLVLAPGMGLNAFFAYSIVLGMGYSWQFALFAVFLEGIIFIILTLTRVREMVFNIIPTSLKYGIGAGIGVYLVYLGLQNGRLIVNNDATLTSLVVFNSDKFHTEGVSAILTCVGVILIVVLSQLKARGAIFWGMIGTWILGILTQIIGVYQVDIEAGYYSLIPAFHIDDGLYKSFQSVLGAAFDFSEWSRRGVEVSGWSLLFSLNVVVILFSLLFVDFFDTLGTVVAVAHKGNFYDKDGKVERLKNILFADAFATTAGAILGTSTTTTFLESATGIAEGGKTGLTALTSAFLFLLAIFFAPIFLAIPSFATSAALIYVGFLMFSVVKHLDFEVASESFAGIVACFAIPLGSSISDGIALSFIFWTIINALMGNFKKISWLIWILTCLFIAKFIFVS